MSGPNLPRQGTKQALLVSMLQRAKGASVGEISNATGWQANSVHSALSTFRKLGWIIVVDAVGAKNRYRLARSEAGTDKALI